MATDRASSLEREVKIAASPERVFEYFTDPEKLMSWLGTEATLDPRPGGTFRVIIAGHPGSGEYVEIDRPRRVVFTWGWEEAGNPITPGSSTVEIQVSETGLDELNKGTLVRLTHRGLPDDAVGDHGQGWNHYLQRLTMAGAGNDPGPDSFATQQA